MPQHDPATRATIEAAERAAVAAAEAAVIKTLNSLGIDTSPASVVEWHADQRWLRRARVGSETVSARNVKAFSTLAAVGTAIAYTIWQLIQSTTGTTPTP